MNMLPPSLQKERLHKVCLVLEGYEEYYYFDRILNFPCLKDKYDVQLINAKSASSIPGIFQAAYAKNIYEIILVVCDKDRKPEQYQEIVSKIDGVLGPGKAKEVITFTRPCTLQVILSHFGDVCLATQAKKAAQPDVERLTGVSNYGAHQDQLKEICNKISYRSYNEMKQRISKLSMNPDDIPSTSMLSLLEHLENQNPQWITEINNALLDDN